MRAMASARGSESGINALFEIMLESAIYLELMQPRENPGTLNCDHNKLDL